MCDGRGCGVGARAGVLNGLGAATYYAPLAAVSPALPATLLQLHRRADQPRHPNAMGCASSKAENDEPSGTTKAGKANTRVDATEGAAKPVQGRPVEPKKEPRECPSDS